jgi:hypothetical protein
MRPEDLPGILPDSQPDPALLERMAADLARDLRPVQPLPSPGRLVAELLAVFAGVSALGGAALGYFGVRHLGPGAIGLIFPALGGLALLAAAASVNAMTPGSRRPFHPAVLLAAACAAMAAICLLIFRDHSLGSYVPQGVTCLKAGLLWAAPTAILVWLVLRRGYAVDRAAAGIAAGTLAGLAGLTVLELHCPNFRLWHIAVWHLGVVPVAAALVAAIYFFGSKRRDAELMQ